MKIKTSDLTTAIATIIGIAEKKTTLPFVNSFRVECRKGRLFLSANNFDAHAEMRIDCDGDLAPFWVNARAFQVACASVSDELEITCDGKKATVKGRGTSALSILEDTPEAPKPPQEAKWTPLGVNAKDITDAIKSVSWAGVEGKQDKPLAEAVWIKTDAQRLKAACADGASMAFFDRPSICGVTEFMFQFKYAKMLCDAIGEAGSVFVGEKHIRSQSDALTVTLKQMEGAYWPLEKLFQMPSTELGRVETAQLIKELNTCRALSAGVDPFCDVTMKFSDAGLWLGYAGQVNQYEATVEGRFAEQSLKIGCERIATALNNMPDVVKFKCTENALMMEADDLTAAVGRLREKT